MGLIINDIKQDHCHILIWRDEEPLDFYLQNVKTSENDRKLLKKYTVERRKKDLLIARLLLQKIEPNAEVAYYRNGKPYLKNANKHISISHSKDLVAIIIHSKKEVSIDIEYISSRVDKLKTRFLSQEEIREANTYEKLTVMWSAKECLFKIDQKQGLDFKKDLQLQFKTEQTLQGIICQSNFYTVNYHIYDNWILSYIIKD